MNRYRRLALPLVVGSAVLNACHDATGPRPGATTFQQGSPQVSSRFIVVFHDEVRDVTGVARSLAGAHGSAPDFVYQDALRGFAATIPDQAARAIARDPRVRYVERDQVVSVAAQTLPWGIDRVDADVSSTRAGDGTGAVSNTHVYIIDTGIDPQHRDLNVVDHVNFAGGVNADCNGHGTHVAGTVAAADNVWDVVGVAPGAPLVGVKVLGCSGYGSMSGVVAGVDWVTRRAEKPAVANMSLGGSASAALDEAVKNSAASGVFYVVAAGNSRADACNYSPARAGTYQGVLTVGATDAQDRQASFSNYGSCVDLWAPGVSILSTRLGGGTTTLSGTSMASPHGAGTAALYLWSNPGASPAALEMALKADAEVIHGKGRWRRTLIELVYAGNY